MTRTNAQAVIEIEQAPPRRGRGRPKVIDTTPVDVAVEAGRVIQARRLELGMSIQDVAYQIGVSDVSYRSIEALFNRYRASRHLDTLSKILDLDPKRVYADWADTPSAIVPDFKLSSYQRADLGRRAMKRRLDLGISRIVMAEKIGTTSVTLNTWEKSFPGHAKEAVKEAWEAALHVPKGWLTDVTLKAPPLIRVVEEKKPAALASNTVADEIRQIGCWLARKNVLRRTWVYSDLTAAEQRYADVFMLRYGLNGHENHTLQAIGNRFGLTRERVRQILGKINTRIRELTPPTQKIDALALKIERVLPATTEEVDRTFRAELGEGLSVVDVDRFSQDVLGRRFAVTTANPERRNAAGTSYVIGNDHLPELIRAIREESTFLIRRIGAAQVHMITGAVSARLAREVAYSDVRDAFRVFPELQWLSEQDGWFWFGDEANNRVFAVLKKMLAATQGRVDVHALNAALARSWKDREIHEGRLSGVIGLPIPVLLELISKADWVARVQYNDFAAETPIKPEDALTGVELDICREMQARGGIAARSTLKRLIVEGKGYSGPTLDVTLAHSAIVESCGHGLFRLVGVAINPEDYAQAYSEALMNRVVATRLDDGRYEINLTIARCTLDYGHYDVPKCLFDLMSDGDYTIEGSSRLATYYHTGSRTKCVRLRGFPEYLMENGIGKGDTIRMLLDVDRRHLCIERTDNQPR